MLSTFVQFHVQVYVNKYNIMEINVQISQRTMQRRNSSLIIEQEFKSSSSSSSITNTSMSRLSHDIWCLPLQSIAFHWTKHIGIQWTCVGNLREQFEQVKLLHCTIRTRWAKRLATSLETQRPWLNCTCMFVCFQCKLKSINYYFSFLMMHIAWQYKAFGWVASM